MREILGIAQHEGSEVRTGQVYLTPANCGPKIASADFHGADIEVVRSRCVSRVGIRGIVVRDTKFTFVVITKKNEIKGMRSLISSTRRPESLTRTQPYPKSTRSSKLRYQSQIRMKIQQKSQRKKDRRNSKGVHL